MSHFQASFMDTKQNCGDTTAISPAMPCSVSVFNPPGEDTNNTNLEVHWESSQESNNIFIQKREAGLLAMVCDDSAHTHQPGSQLRCLPKPESSALGRNRLSIAGQCQCKQVSPINIFKDTLLPMFLFLSIQCCISLMHYF